jgi:phosphoglycolate phosphatase-like HAD superfamily hydrolase
MNQITAIGFDLDQTLTRSNHLNRTVSEALEQYLHNIIQYAVQHYDAVKLAYSSLGLRHNPLHAHIIHVKNTLRDRTIGVTDDALEAIEAASEAGLKLYIVSNGPGAEWGKRLTRTLSSSFHTALFSEDVLAPKGDPAGILQALDFLGISEKNSLYIGNARTDMRAAISAGVTPVAMGISTSAAKTLRSMQEEGTLSRGLILPNWNSFRAGLDTGFEGEFIGYET